MGHTRSRVLLLTTVAAVFVAGCRRAPAAEWPAAEFLLATGDSTYWVRAGASGLTVRSSPLLLTHDGRDFHEIYVSDDDRVWPDAFFLAQRLWRRNLLTGDSIELAHDSVVMPLALRYAQAHRDLPLLPDDEPLPETPSRSAASEFEVVDMHGPYLSWMRHVDIEADDMPLPRHELHWRVTDVRTGAEASHAALFGATVGARLEATAVTAFAAARDSLSRGAARRADRSREAIASMHFNPRSFSLSDRAGAPVVIPMTVAADSAGQVATLALPALAVPGPAPAWWTAAQATLPLVAPDSSSLTWTRQGYRVIARFDAAGDRLTFALAATRGRRRVEERIIGTMAWPAWSLVSLDQPAVDAKVRDALARAFRDAQTYNEDGRQLARGPGPVSERQTVGLHRRVVVPKTSGGRRVPLTTRRARRVAA